MNKKTKNAIFLVLLILTTLAIAISVILYLQKNQGKNPVTTTTNKGIIETQTTTKSKFTEEINSETETNEESITEEKIEETKQQITTTKSSNLSNNSSNKTETKETTTKKPTTTKPTTEKVTSSPKDKFPEGYIVTSNPHGNPSTEGDYWTSCSEKYIWKAYPEDEEVCDEDGNILKGDWWLNDHVNGYCPPEKKYILYEAMGKYSPKHEGTYDGEVYEYTIWVWIPD